jgi:ribosomal protein S9
MKPYKTANTGKNFRVAEGTLIPNEGELRLNGESNQAPLDFKAQVAKVTKPLASTIEMADAGNIVITHKDGGLVKHLSPEGLARVMAAIQSEVGTELVIQRKESTYVFDMEIAAPQPKGKTVTAPMEVGHVAKGNRWAPFWEVEEEDFNCTPCAPFRRPQ